jgi:potassium inwardly-rectifying channel subfamily J
MTGSNLISDKLTNKTLTLYVTTKSENENNHKNLTQIDSNEKVDCNITFEFINESNKNTNVDSQKSQQQMQDLFNITYFNKKQRFKCPSFRKPKQNTRLIHKNGDSNVNRINIQSLSRKYIADLFTTLIDMKWGYVLILFILSYLTSWLIFASLWFSIQLIKTNCVTNLGKNYTFTSLLLFSIETQQTIGYGSRYISDECESGVLLVMIQSCFSIFLQSFMGGIVFAKLSIPKKRTETLIFSKNAVVSLRDGVYCLMCRVGDLRKSHIIQANISMYILKTRYTIEGECIPCYVQELDINQSTNRLLLMPVIVEHRIDQNSPLYDMLASKSNGSASSSSSQCCLYDCFKSEDFEIIVLLEGTVESTGATTQARTSYLPNEILWNCIFTPLFDLNKNKPTIDFSKFDETVPLKCNKNSSVPNSVQNTISTSLSFYVNEKSKMVTEISDNIYAME